MCTIGATHRLATVKMRDPVPGIPLLVLGKEDKLGVWRCERERPARNALNS
jgi:hypothetical protein